MERPYGGNCWTRETALEISFILILIIAVPILISLIVVYAYFITNRSVIEEIANTSQREPNITSSVRRRMVNLVDADFCLFFCGGKDAGPNCYEETEGNKALLPFIVSISETVYVDDPGEYRYRCSAVAITYKFVLTAKKCIAVRPLRVLSLRAGSNYWHSGGSVHAISKIYLSSTAKTNRDGDRFHMALAELARPLPQANAIGMPYISFASHATEDLKIVAWLNRRKTMRHMPMQMLKLGLVECPIWGQSKDVICAKERTPSGQQQQLECNSYMGSALISANELIGVCVNTACLKGDVMLVFKSIEGSWAWLGAVTGRRFDQFS